MSAPAPITLRWHGQHVRVRHDDPRLNPYSAVIQRLEAAMSITTTVDTLRLVVAREAAYDVRVLEDVGSSRVDLQACKLEYSIVSPK